MAYRMGQAQLNYCVLNQEQTSATYDQVILYFLISQEFV